MSNSRRAQSICTAAQAFFRKALDSTLPRVPRKVTLDSHVPSRRALLLLRREHQCWRNVKVRTNKYHNLVEQDYRAIKRRCAARELEAGSFKWSLMSRFGFGRTLA